MIKSISLAFCCQSRKLRGCLVENDRSEKVMKSGQIFENSRRLAGFLTRIFGNMDDFTGFAADFFNQTASWPITGQ